MAYLPTGYWPTYWSLRYWPIDYWPELRRSQFQVELFVSPPPREIYFTNIEEEITFE